MSKDDIICGIIVATILVGGGVMCVLGYKKLTEPIWKEDKPKAEATSVDTQTDYYSQVNNGVKESLDQDSEIKYTNEQSESEETITESNDTEETNEENDSRIEGDLFDYLEHPADDIKQLLGKPTGHLGSGTIYADDCVQIGEFEGKVCDILLLNGTLYTILGFKPGDSAEALEELLKDKYEAKEYHRELGSNHRGYYFYVNGEVRFVGYYFDENGNIDTISCQYDELGTFEEPKDMSGVNPYSFTEDWDDLENLNLADQ